MIDVDPVFYLGDNYRIRWRCPRCKERSYIRLATMESEACPECAQTLSEADRRALSAFRDLIGDPAPAVPGKAAGSAA